jgi:hypothetical protein
MDVVDQVKIGTFIGYAIKNSATLAVTHIIYNYHYSDPIEAASPFTHSNMEIIA